MHCAKNTEILDVEIAIIGAGPAGLAAASCCRTRGHTFALVEKGSLVEKRDHTDAIRLAQGVGGSGLYSDGKFSFYPSATQIWRLPDRPALAAGYKWLTNLLPDFGLTPPDFPENNDSDGLSNHSSPECSLESKKYPSFYVDLENRERLTSHLENICGSSLIPDFSVVNIEFDEKEHRFICQAANEDSEAHRCLSSKTLIFAGGRFGPIGLFSLMPQIPKIFKRIEVGVRIEQPSSNFFLNHHPQLDPKFVLRTDALHEYRTFCCCRNGETVTIETEGLKAVSGRGDCNPSGRSNIGFNLRVDDETEGTLLWNELSKSLTRNSNKLPVTESWKSFMDSNLHSQPSSSNGITEIFGLEISKQLAQGLSKFEQAMSLDLSSATLVAPAIEAVAFYPQIDQNLKAPGLPLWVAGDSTGVFRGLTAAFISGHYAATQAINFLKDN